MIPPLEKRNWVHPYYLTRITIFFQTLVKDNQNRAPYPTCEPHVIYLFLQLMIINITCLWFRDPKSNKLPVIQAGSFLLRAHRAQMDLFLVDFNCSLPFHVFVIHPSHYARFLVLEILPSVSFSSFELWD